MGGRRHHPLIAIVTAAAVTGCATVTINRQGDRKISSSPTYQASKAFFLWGLVPDDRSIDVAQICGGAEAKQMQTQFTFLDGLPNFITLGIYAPRTVKVWCS